MPHLPSNPFFTYDPQYLRLSLGRFEGDTWQREYGNGDDRYLDLVKDETVALLSGNIHEGYVEVKNQWGNQGWVPASFLQKPPLDLKALPALLAGSIGDVVAPKRYIFGPLSYCAETAKPTFARALDLGTFNALTSPDVEGEKEMSVLEDCRRVAELSMDGHMQFRAYIKPSYGFAKKWGLWIPPDLEEFARGALIVFVAGFNDCTEILDRPDCVQKQIEEHVKWYSYFSEKLVFVEPNDHQGNDVSLLTEMLEALKLDVIPSGVDDENSAESDAFLFPKEGWSSEVYSKDTWHLRKDKLSHWLRTRVKTWATKLAEKHQALKVLFVTDSTFAAHDYHALARRPKHDINITVSFESQSGWQYHCVSASLNDTIDELKNELSKRHYPNRDVRASDLHLIRKGVQLQGSESLGSLGVEDGELMYLSVPPALARLGEGGPSDDLPPESIYIGRNLFATEDKWSRTRDGTVIPLASVHCNYREVQCQVWYSMGMHDDRTLAEEGFFRSRGINGVYSIKNDVEAAFRFARKVQYGGTWYKVVVKSLVKSTEMQEIEVPSMQPDGAGQKGGGFCLCLTHDMSSIVPHAILIREEGDYGFAATGDADPPRSSIHFTRILSLEETEALSKHLVDFGRREKQRSFASLDEFCNAARERFEQVSQEEVLGLLKQQRHRGNGLLRFEERVDALGQLMFCTTRTSRPRSSKRRHLHDAVCSPTANLPSKSEISSTLSSILRKKFAADGLFEFESLDELMRHRRVQMLSVTREQVIEVAKTSRREGCRQMRFEYCHERGIRALVESRRPGR